MKIEKTISPLPTKIDPCRIVEAIIELRFELESNIPSGAIIGMLYTELQNDKYSTPKELPITKIPEIVRQEDINLRFKPTYQIENDKFIIQLGDNVLVVVNKTDNKNPYVGKDIFLNELDKILKQLKHKTKIKNYVRLGIRYIDFFSFDIFKESELKATLSGKVLDGLGLNMTILDEGIFKKNLQVSNNIEINIDNKKQKGSIIDIDTYKKFEKVSSNEIDILNMLSDAHLEGKKLFFEVLGENMIKKLKPKYD